MVNGQLPHPHAPSHRLQSPRANLTIANAKHGKELQFVSQQLTHEVSQKTESIENLQYVQIVLLSWWICDGEKSSFWFCDQVGEYCVDAGDGNDADANATIGVSKYHSK